MLENADIVHLIVPIAVVWWKTRNAHCSTCAAFTRRDCVSSRDARSRRWRLAAEEVDIAFAVQVHAHYLPMRRFL